MMAMVALAIEANRDAVRRKLGDECLKKRADEIYKDFDRLMWLGLLLPFLLVYGIGVAGSLILMTATILFPDFVESRYLVGIEDPFLFGVASAACCFFAGAVVAFTIKLIWLNPHRDQIRERVIETSRDPETHFVLETIAKVDTTQFGKWAKSLLAIKA